MFRAPLINSKTIQIILVLTFGLMGSFPLIPEQYEGVVVICFLVTSLIIFLLNAKNIGVLKKEFFITGALFFVLLISALLSNEINEGFKKIATMLSLLLFPLVFFIFLGNSKIDYPKYEAVYFKVFFTSNVLFSLLSFYLFSIYSSPKFSIKNASFFRNAVSDIPLIGDHPIYISIFLSIAILIGITFYNFRKQHALFNILIAVGHLILGTLLTLLMSKGVIIALFIALCVLLSRKIKYMYVYSILIVLLFGLLIPSANNRFKELLKNETYFSLNNQNSTSIRVNILKCSCNLVSNKPILGYGLGDVQGELDKCYSVKNYGFEKGKYNSHNQYLFVWLSVGIFGLILFISILVFYFKCAITHKDYLMLSIIILYSIVFLFENVLSRQSGVILFSFILNMMLRSNTDLTTKNKI